jgi:hypothetical protein
VTPLDACAFGFELLETLRSDGTLKHAQTMAAHSSDERAFDEYDKVRI